MKAAATLHVTQSAVSRGLLLVECACFAAPRARAAIRDREAPAGLGGPANLQFPLTEAIIDAARAGMGIPV